MHCDRQAWAVKVTGICDLLAQRRPICRRHSILTSPYRTLMPLYYCAVRCGDSDCPVLLRRLRRENCERKLGQARTHLRRCKFRWVVAGSASGSRPRYPAVPLPRSKPSCDGKFYHSSSSLSSSSPARYSHPYLLPQALRLTISLTSCMYVDTIAWPPLLPMPTCSPCYLLAHICCPHVLSDPTSLTHQSVYLPRSELLSISIFVITTTRL